jgi:putative NADPH-quinone reductase
MLHPQWPGVTLPGWIFDAQRRRRYTYSPQAAAQDMYVFAQAARARSMRCMKSQRRILIIDGHPDPDRQRFIHALAVAYAQGAAAAGHEVRRIDVASLELHSLRSNSEFLHELPSEEIRRCQADLSWAGHVVILFPLWLGDMPGLLKILLEQIARPGFAFRASRTKGLQRKLLAGRSARIVVTMGMPALFYRWYYRAHSVKNLERNILGFCGISPARRTLLGMVEGASNERRERWLAQMRKLGARAH